MATEKDVYKVLSELEQRILGISDDPSLKKDPRTGYIISMLQESAFINPDDYANPAQPGITDDDPATTTKRQQALANLCDLVDHKLAMDGSGMAIPSTTPISQTWELIINSANAMPGTDKTDPALQKSIEEANKLLFSTDADGNVTESKAYLNYQDYRNKYNDAVDKLSDEYLNARSDPAKFQQWPTRGLRFKDDARAAWDKWMAMGKKKEIEAALDFISAQGTDAAVHCIANAKRRLEDNRMLLGSNQYYYVSVSPSNWADPNAVEGWAEYTYDSTKSKTSETASSRKWSGKAGFWKISASASGSKTTLDTSSQEEKLTIKFNYAFVTINWHAFTTILPNIGNWFVKNNRKGCVSNGTANQQKPANETSWLPAITTKMVVVKNVTINSSEIVKNSSEITNTLKAGGKIGWSVFSGSGSYEKTSSSKQTGVELTSEGLVFHGAQVIAFAQEILPMCPQFDDPSLNAHS